MRKIFFVTLVLGLVAISSHAQKGVMKFKEESHNFGKIEQGKPVTHTFVFRNTGTDPVVISKVEVSCGCTTPDFSREPVLPGQTGVISATYDAAGLNAFVKPLTVLSNAESPSITLYLKGEVVRRAVADSARSSLRKE